MKLLQKLKIAAILGATIASFNPTIPVFAQVYGEKPVEAKNFIPVAQPLSKGYKLLLIEQVPGKQQCWGEKGSSPTQVELLLNNFDYSGICKTFKDANGYSVRIDGDDYGLDYLLDIEQKDGELLLVATPSLGSNQPKLIIGRSMGLGQGSLKLFLEPGWNFAQRTFENKGLGHIYFSGDSAQFAQSLGPAPIFPDTRRDIYRTEIEEAVKIGFIGGFPDKTFKPTESLTRAQIVSMVYDALSKVEGAKLPDVSAKPTVATFPDVPTNHWAAAKIKWAQDSGIVKGNPDGSFKPNDPVTRAQLMSILKNTTLYGQKLTGKSQGITASNQPVNFSDVPNGQWYSSTVKEMSSFCKVASPLNESGTGFYPNNPAQRNYAAAATLRMLNCLKR